MKRPENEPNQSEKRRVLPLETATRTFALQLQLFPELLKEFSKLSGGSIGVVNALLEKIGDEISYNPYEDMNPERVRAFAGAPVDDAELPAWREKFWDDFKAAKGI